MHPVQYMLFGVQQRDSQKRALQKKFSIYKDNYPLQLLTNMDLKYLEKKYGGQAENMAQNYWPPQSFEHYQPHESIKSQICSREDYRKMFLFGNLKSNQLCLELLLDSSELKKYVPGNDKKLMQELLVKIRNNQLTIDAVSYTHLTLPTICSVQISVVAVSLKKKKKENLSEDHTTDLLISLSYMCSRQC
eukprot:TRINITY_DN23760_c0_g1_i1.p2 TRINITY_DN23760_c0_g1~~TRINITY_DN23760_c0_g1_i1.p2  ORF type:complete len:190 (-),score=31.06 TRINITY_DN23760_c0_g1_i1:31-600(-)